MSDPCCPACGHVLDARGRCPSRTCRTELTTLSDVPCKKSAQVIKAGEQFCVVESNPTLLANAESPPRRP